MHVKAALGRIFLCGAVAAQAELEDHLRSVLSVDLAERTLHCLEGQLDDMRKALATLQSAVGKQTRHEKRRTGSMPIITTGAGRPGCLACRRPGSGRGRKAKIGERNLR